MRRGFPAVCFRRHAVLVAEKLTEQHLVSVVQLQQHWGQAELEATQGKCCLRGKEANLKGLDCLRCSCNSRGWPWAEERQRCETLPVPNSRPSGFRGRLPWWRGVLQGALTLLVQLKEHSRHWWSVL